MYYSSALTLEIPWEPPFELPDVKHAFSVLSTVPPLWTLYEDPVVHMAELDPIDEPVEGIKLCGGFNLSYHC